PSAGSSTSTLTVSVAAVNDAPVVHAPASIQIAENGAFTFSGGNALSVTDVDGGTGNETAELSWSHGTITAPMAGTLTGTDLSIGGPLSFINEILQGLEFTPDAGFTGQVGLTVSINDNGNTGTGGAMSDSKTVAIDVAPSVGNTAMTNEDTPLTVDAVHGLLANSTDAATVTEGNFTTAQGGTIHINADGSYTYDPAQDFNGVDTVNYTLNDPSAGSSTSTLTVSVAAVNDAPVVHAPASIQIAKNGCWTFSGGNALSVTDVDSGTGNETAELSWSHGTITAPMAGTLTGTDLSIGGPLSFINEILQGLEFTPDAG